MIGLAIGVGVGTCLCHALVLLPLQGIKDKSERWKIGGAVGVLASILTLVFSVLTGRT